MNNKSSERLFFKYISQNILGMLGISAYVLADTFFISKSEGANGIAALNLILPLYSIIFAIGQMIGIGYATGFKIQRAKEDKRAEYFLSNAIVFSIIISTIFIFVGAFFSKEILYLLGGRGYIALIGAEYTKIFMLFAPFFMLNYIFNAFVRNDGAPSIAMAATLLSSLFNIVMDYILMFPLGMGMKGAALATALSPILGILICCIHFFTDKNTLSLKLTKLDFKQLIKSCLLGFAAFIGELSSGVTTMVFNFIILSITGDIGVAAYGIVANVSIVAICIFNGIAQGTQPLLSDYYGRGNTKALKKILKLSISTSLVFSILILLLINIFAGNIVDIFNSDNNAIMYNYAIKGLRLYFIGFIFAGFNIIGTGYLSSTESALWAFITSILRGFVAIIFFAFLLSYLFKMTGVWLAFCACELFTSILVIIAINKTKKARHND